MVILVLQVTGVSPNTSTNLSPMSSSVLNGESPGDTQTQTQTQGSVPVIKVNGKLYSPASLAVVCKRKGHA